MTTRPTQIRRFTNAYGERWQVRIDPQQEIGFLSGGEIDGEVEIRDGRIGADLLLSAEEHECLAGVWREATGGELEKPLMLRLSELLANMKSG